jgi:hypothetical protein
LVDIHGKPIAIASDGRLTLLSFFRDAAARSAISASTN